MTNEPTQRLHALDALRGGALLLGIAFHAALSFFSNAWPVIDIDRSATLFVACFVAHIFRMSVFYVIAGFFARMSFHRRGLRDFVMDRLKRIGVPLVVGWPLLLVAVGLVLTWADGNWNDLPPAVAEKLPFTWRTVPLIHLWFLYVLLWFYAAALFVVRLLDWIDRRQRLGAWTDKALRVVVTTNTAPIVLGAPLFAVFILHDSWIPEAGVPTPYYGLLPNLAAVVAYGSAFGFGWLLHRQIDLLDVCRRWWPLHLVLATVTTTAALSFYGEGELSGDAPTTAIQLLAAAVYPLAMWTWTFALVGLGMACMSGYSPVRRYLADSSYWLYLIHIPIIIALQAMFAELPWPWFAKYPAILVLAFVPMIASYHFLVRGTAIGALLNGRRYGSGRTSPPGPIGSVESDVKR
jgi:glucan biosynthesis protein C